MLAFQLDLFEKVPDEIEILNMKYTELFNRSENVRKGAYQKITMLTRELTELKETMDFQEKRLVQLESLFNPNLQFHRSSQIY